MMIIWQPNLYIEHMKTQMQCVIYLYLDFCFKNIMNELHRMRNDNVTHMLSIIVHVKFCLRSIKYSLLPHNIGLTHFQLYSSRFFNNKFQFYNNFFSTILIILQKKESVFVSEILYIFYFHSFRISLSPKVFCCKRNSVSTNIGFSCQYQLNFRCIMNNLVFKLLEMTTKHRIKCH